MQNGAAQAPCRSVSCVPVDTAARIVIQTPPREPESSVPWRGRFLCSGYPLPAFVGLSYATKGGACWAIPGMQTARCGICKGRFGPIHYDEPSDSSHPLSFVIDEIRPVSKWKAFGYASPRAAAEDWTNLQPAHYFCNAQKGNKTSFFDANIGEKLTKAPAVKDGEW